jgi:AcrR family transcriptional regulator
VTPRNVAVRRPRGRPRNPDVEALVLDATISLLRERGLQGTTVNAVVERSGVARATVYLRWPNRQALLIAAVRRAMGTAVLQTSGDVYDDLRRGSDRLRGILRSPSFRAVFPALVASLTGHDGSPDGQIDYAAVAPGRDALIATYREHAAGQGFRVDVPPALVADALIGTHIGHYLATGKPPSVEVTDQIVDIIAEGLRRRGS